MRFIPYVGAMISAIFPLLLAFAVAPGWDMVLWTLGLIVVLELISNNVIEPWLYGESTGLSTLSIIVSATFWTALWGPIGLILATPLTVCLLVLGRYLPSLKFLDLLLGSEPVLDAPHRLYQRLLAGDLEDALELAQADIDAMAGAKPDQADLAAAVTHFYDDTAVPMLRIGAKQHQEATSEHRLRLATGMKAMLRELQADYPPPAYVQTMLDAAAQDDAATPILCLGARWEMDAASAAMVAHALCLRGLPASAAPWAMGARADAEVRLDGPEVQVVCLCTFSPAPQAQVRQLIRRLRRQNAQLTVLVAAWNSAEDLFGEEAAQQLGAADVVDSVDGVALRAHAMLQSDAEMGWSAAEVPEDDDARTQALRASGFQGAACVPICREAARQAMNAFDVPFAQVSLVDRDWVHTPGSLLHAPGGQAMAAGLPRDQSPAAWVVAEGRPFVVEDASRDPRFAQNPALRAHGVRFYAGVPLRIKQGPVLGSLDILDTQARELRDGELETLADMAAQLAKDLQAAQAKAKPQVDRTAGDS
jgi:GAF domain-containing protein